MLTQTKTASGIKHLKLTLELNRVPQPILAKSCCPGTLLCLSSLWLYLIEGFSSAVLHCKDPQRLFTTTYTILLHYTTEMHQSSLTLSDPGVV